MTNTPTLAAQPPKLLPCAHCGGHAVMENLIVEAVIYCEDCRARIRSKHAAMEDTGVAQVIAAWNRRTPPAAVDAPAEAVAWACFAENGNIRLWSRLNEDIKALAARNGWRLTPLFTHPASPVPAADVVDAARRYEWLREHIYIDPLQKILRIAGIYLPAGMSVAQAIDEAIDAAMSKGA